MQGAARAPGWAAEAMAAGVEGRRFCCEAVGRVVRPERAGTVDELRSRPAAIELVDGLCEGLRGLEPGALAWVIWYAHLSPPPPGPLLRARDGSERGVFATRSPSRPCPLGLSLVRLLRAEGCRLVVLGLDAVDGTPVLDIKPYSPSLDDPSSLPRVADGG